MNEFDNNEPLDISKKPIDEEIKSESNIDFITDEDIDFYKNTFMDEKIDVEPPVFEENLEMDKKEVFFSETVKNENENYKKGKFRRVVALVCMASILGGTTLGIGLGMGNYIGKNYIMQKFEKEKFLFDKSNSGDPNVKPVSDVSTTRQNIYSDVLKKVEASVVCITVAKESTNSIFNMPLETGAGSGIIFTEDAENVFIVTNYHVIGGANKVGIVIGESEAISAKLVGSEPSSDLAVISISKEDIKAAGIKDIVIAKFGSSDSLEVGEQVLAIGNALGEGKTATQGIISAKDKEINIQGTVLNVVQTDAAINPGNSGGALVNMQGEVIGINTAKFSESSVEGMGYSITSDVAMPIIERLKNQEERPFLGIQGDNISEEIAKMYNLPSMGVYIGAIVEGSSAESAGILVGDIITSFNGEPVLNFKSLQDIISKCKVGDKVKIKILREGKNTMEINVTLSKNSQTEF